MESQPQNPKFRNNLETFTKCMIMALLFNGVDPHAKYKL